VFPALHQTGSGCGDFRSRPFLSRCHLIYSWGCIKQCCLNVSLSRWGLSIAHVWVVQWQLKSKPSSLRCNITFEGAIIEYCTSQCYVHSQAAHWFRQPQFRLTFTHFSFSCLSFFCHGEDSLYWTCVLSCATTIWPSDESQFG
jgi:hypothetical protein